MRAPKKIHPDVHFLEFIKVHFHKEHKEIWEPLFENRQQYFDCLAKKRVYNFEAIPMDEFAKKIGVSVKKLEQAVSIYLFKPESE